MPLTDRKYKKDQTIIKVFGYGNSKKIKVIHCNNLRTTGIEDDEEKRAERGTVNDEKLENNIARAKSKIYELAYCNPWEYFFTATLNKDKHDRTDINEFHKKLMIFLSNCKRDYGLSEPIKFLLIPEKHKDGKSWHMHGFIYGLPVDKLKLFRIGDTMGKALADKIKNGDEVYDWLDYKKKFGFCSLERVKNHEAVSKYVTKYINKGLMTSVKEINSHMYYRSRGLKGAEEITKGTMFADIVPTYTHEHGWFAEFEYSDKLLHQLSNSIRKMR